MTAETLALIVGAILSLAFAYIPGLRTKYEALSSEMKAAIMAGIMLIVTITIYAMACASVLNLFGVEVACTKEGAAELLKILISALMANQASYLLLVKPYKA
jgi:uncharacterized membrane protein